MAENKMKSLDDIIFEHKNKSYGAYRLRNTERGYLMKAFFIGTAIFVVFVLLLYFYNRWQAKKGVEEKAVKIELTDLKAPEEEKKEEIFKQKDEPPPPPPTQQDEVAQVKMVMPNPKKIVKNEQTVPKVEDTKDKALGTEDKDGKNTNDPAIKSGEKNNVPPGPPPPPIPTVDPKKIFTQVDQEAEFKGGGLKEVSKFISRYMEYTDRAYDNGTEGKITVRFVVEKDGSVSDVQVSGKKLGDGLDEVAIAAIKRTSKMWTPAKVNNEAVRSYFRVPVTFRLPQ